MDVCLCVLGELVLAIRQTPDVHTSATQQSSHVSPSLYKIHCTRDNILWDRYMTQICCIVLNILKSVAVCHCNGSYCAAVLIGCITGLACLSVHLSRTESCTLRMVRVAGVPIFSSKSPRSGVQLHYISRLG